MTYDLWPMTCDLWAVTVTVSTTVLLHVFEVLVTKCSNFCLKINFCLNEIFNGSISHIMAYLVFLLWRILCLSLNLFAQYLLAINFWQPTSRAKFKAHCRIVIVVTGSEFLLASSNRFSVSLLIVSYLLNLVPLAAISASQLKGELYNKRYTEC